MVRAARRPSRREGRCRIRSNNGSPRRAARPARLSLLYGLSRVVGGLLAAVARAGIGRLSDPVSTIRASALGQRWPCCRAGSGRRIRYLYPAFARRLADVEIARQIERRFPRSRGSAVERGRVSQAVRGRSSGRQRGLAAGRDRRNHGRRRTAEFGRSARAAAGPAGAGRGGGRAAGRAGSDRFAIRSRPGWRWPGWSAPLATMPGRASTTWRSSHPPTRIAAGQTFEVELRDRNGTSARRRADSLSLRKRRPSDEEVESMHLLDGVLVARKENVARPFKYRAEGGDDRSMDWISLEVVEPPRIDSLQPRFIRRSIPAGPWSRPRTIFMRCAARASRLPAATTKPITAATLRVADGTELACPVSRRRLRLRAVGRRSRAARDRQVRHLLVRARGHRGPDRRPGKRCAKFAPWPTSRRASTSSSPAPTCSSRPRPWCRCESWPRTIWPSTRLRCTSAARAPTNRGQRGLAFHRAEQVAAVGHGPDRRAWRATADWSTTLGNRAAGAQAGQPGHLLCLGRPTICRKPAAAPSGG